MTALRRLLKRLKASILSRGSDQRLRDELAEHRALLTEEYVRAGYALPEARRLAAIKLGVGDAVTEAVRDQERMIWLEDVRRAVRQTLRSLLRRPGFTVTAVVVMALSIGVNIATFSLVHAVLLEPLPYPDAGKLTFITAGPIGDDSRRRPLAGPELGVLARAATLHEGVGAIWPTSGTIVANGQATPVRLGLVTPNFLSILGVPPVSGRSFTSADSGSGTAPAMIISHAFWQSRFAGTNVIGQRVRLDGGWGFFGDGLYTIVGVMGPQFEMLLPLRASVPRTLDLWIPFPYDVSASAPKTYFLRAVGRVAPGASLAAAQEQIESVGAALIKEYGLQPNSHVYAVPLSSDAIEAARLPLVMLQGAVSLVLLIACANVANLLLVRSRTRRHELGVRTAMGASSRHLVAVVLTEGLTLAALAGGTGMALAYGVIYALPASGVDILPRARDVSVGLPAVAFCVLVTALSGLVFSLPAILQAVRTGTSALLKGTGTGPRGDALKHWRNSLVVSQVALSLVLLVVAGLLVRTFLNLQAVDLGYHADQVVTFKLTLRPDPYASVARLAAFSRTLEQGLHSVVGVRAAGAINQLPLDVDTPNWSTPYVSRRGAEGRAPMVADARLVTPGFFETVNAQLVAGRWFTERDDETQPTVLLVDEKLARRTWPGENPLNQELSVEVWTEEGFRPRWGRVVGVVHHLRHQHPSVEVREQVFIPFAQAPRNQLAVVVRGRQEAESLMREIGRFVGQIDPGLSPFQVERLDTYLSRSRAPARFSMIVCVVFAVLSLLLACVGVYSVISYAVTQRLSEFAVRIALGATRADVVRLVAIPGLKMTGLGLLIGVVGAAAVGRWMSGLLFGIAPFDVPTSLAAACCLGATAVFACWLPARRATTVEPATILRSE